MYWMRRREFITLLGGAATWPITARAQSKVRMPKVGVLMAVSESDPESQKRIAAFRQGLVDLGWKDGQNIQVEYRWADGKIELIRQYSKELVALAPNVILVNSTPAIQATKEITSSIPIVCALVIDPVGFGFAKSLSRPGGNITGFTFINAELIGKWTDLLKDVTPGFTQAAVMHDPRTTPFYRNFLREIEAARAANELAAISVESTADIETGINLLAQKTGSGLIIGPDPFTSVHIRRIAQLAAQKRLPAISVHRQFVLDGGLMAYGPDTADIFRRSATYIDRILKGEKPAELPVQQPNKFEFIVNLKTAQSFGLTVPRVLLSTADEVIE
jgi:putative ABC transport system substrate-binding protein